MKTELQNKLIEKYPEFFENLRKHNGPVIPIQFGFECFPKNTMLLGEVNKNIEDFDVLDHLYGEYGLQKIINKFEKEYNGDLIKIEAAGLLPIYSTPEHPYLTVTSNTKYKPTNIIYNYKNAIDLLPKIRHKNGGDYLSVPIIKGTDNTTLLNITQFRKKQKSGVLKVEELILNEEISWFFGLYVAEGSIFNGGIQISLHKNETLIIDKIKTIFNVLGYSVFITNQKGSNGVVVSISCKTLSRAFDFWCGHLAENKQIPNFILNNINLNIIKSFLNGYNDGDGSLYKSYGKIIGVKSNTVSKKLSLQLQLAYAKFKLFGRISIKESSVENINGRICNTKTKYSLSVNYNNNKDIIVDNDKILTPIRKISKEKYNGLVYNFTTLDNTYLVNNIVVHNCGDGWFWLLDNLMNEISSYFKHNSTRKRIKNKQLRIFHNILTDFSNSLPHKYSKYLLKVTKQIRKKAKWEDHVVISPVNITQIKEKYGGLCFYYTGGDDVISGMVNLAESLSYKICETCGTTENVHQTKGWIYTLCDKCEQEKNK